MCGPPGLFTSGLLISELICSTFTGDIIATLLANRFISPNAVYPPESGTTPLHLAASEGRVDVVDLLLDQEGIDDSLLDTNGKSCEDVAKGTDVLNAIQGAYSL